MTHLKYKIHISFGGTPSQILAFLPSTLYIMRNNYEPAKFVVATSNGLGGDAFT